MAAFNVVERQRVHQRLVERAQADERIASAALVGSLAGDGGDRWSDLDLTFGIADGHHVNDVLDEWSHYMGSEFDAVTLIDLESGGAIYRVFLLDGGLQVDLSFVQRAAVRQASPRFRLLFGTHTSEEPRAPDASALFGWAVLYVRHARVCIERGRSWQAAYCVSEARNRAMAIACVGSGLPADFGRGFDNLPPDVRTRFEPTLVGNLKSDALLASLEKVAAALVAVAGPAVPASAQVTARVEQLVQ